MDDWMQLEALWMFIGEEVASCFAMMNYTENSDCLCSSVSLIRHDFH